MKLDIVAISASGKQHRSVAQMLAANYIERAQRYSSCEVSMLPSEEKLIAFLEKASGRTRPVLVLTDSRGQQVSSPELAEAVGRFRDSGLQQIIFAVGPADGWSDAIYARADLVIAFGRITLPHEVAAVVLAEQVYRALTILAGHPYHTGH